MSEQSDLKTFPTTLDEMDELLVRASLASAPPTLLFDAQRVRDHHQRLLLESSSVQWLATWSRALRGLIRIAHDDNEQPLDVLRRVSDTLPGAVVGLLPEISIEQVTKQSVARFRDAYFRKQLAWPDLNLHANAALVCADTLPADIALPALLYPDRRSFAVADRERFGIVADKLISSVAQERSIRGAINVHRDRLTTILHELFKNTHDHARTTTDRRPLGLSIRGIYSRFYPEQSLREAIPVDDPGKRGKASSTQAFPPLNQVEQYAAFFLGLGRQRAEGLRQKAPSEFLGLLELSVFDTGPGLAATYLKDRFDASSVQEQFDAVIGCFQTGKSSTDDESRGYGLWKVLRDLRVMKGLIRVRTNRINVYRDFARFEDMWIKREEIVAPEERLLDWKRGLTSKVGEGYPDVQGASISILIPLGEGL